MLKKVKMKCDVCLKREKCENKENYLLCEDFIVDYTVCGPALFKQPMEDFDGLF